MKRIFATLLAVMMIFSLTACQKESAPEPAPGSTSETTHANTNEQKRPSVLVFPACTSSSKSMWYPTDTPLSVPLSQLQINKNITGGNL